MLYVALGFSAIGLPISTWLYSPLWRRTRDDLDDLTIWWSEYGLGIRNDPPPVVRLEIRRAGQVWVQEVRVIGRDDETGRVRYIMEERLAGSARSAGGWD